MSASKSAITVTFHGAGRKAQFPPDPAYPEGRHLNIDGAASAGRTCLVDLPYPAEECGLFIVRCEACGFSAAITAAGRPDDPRTVRLPCKGRPTAN